VKVAKELPNNRPGKAACRGGHRILLRNRRLGFKSRQGIRIWLYVSSSNSKFSNAKISNVTLPTFKCSNGHLFEWAKVRHVISLNSMFPKRQIVKQKNVRTLSQMTQPYWAALFSDNFALRGVFRLG
jgi:hypothetical protein